MTARTLAAACLGGTVAGILSGVLARLEMRAVVLLRGEPAEFGPATVGIVLIFVILSIFLATLYLWRGQLLEKGKSWWVLVGASLFAAVMLATPLRAEARSLLELLLFVPTFLLLGPLTAWTAGWLVGRLPPQVGGAATVVYRSLAVLAISATIVTPLFIAFGILQIVGVVEVPTS